MSACSQVGRKRQGSRPILIPSPSFEKILSEATDSLDKDEKMDYTYDIVIYQYEIRV